MTRIFTTLASLSIGLYAAAIVLGLGMGDLAERPLPPEVLQWKGVHLLTGAASALAVVLVHSIVVTYFIGTSRWCKEVTETYRFDPELLLRSKALKRRAFPWSLIGMMTVVGVGALGAASDPGTGRSGTEETAVFHLAAAFAGLMIVGWTYYKAWNNITANQAVIEQIVARVGEVRAARGLDIEPAQPQQQPAAVGPPAS